RIRRFADGGGARERSQRPFGDGLGEVAPAFVSDEPLAVGRSDAGALLPAVLEGVEAEVGELCGFRMAVDREYAAMVVEFVVRESVAREEMFAWPQRIFSAELQFR